MREKNLATDKNVNAIAEATGFDADTIKTVLIHADVLEREVFMRQVEPRIMAKVFTGLRKKYAAAIDKMRREGYDKAVPNYAICEAMKNAVGEENFAAVNQDIYAKAVYEGFMVAVVIFDDYKNESVKG